MATPRGTFDGDDRPPGDRRDAPDVDLERKRKAAQRILDAEPMDVPETVEELKRELDELRESRFA